MLHGTNCILSISCSAEWGHKIRHCSKRTCSLKFTKTCSAFFSARNISWRRKQHMRRRNRRRCELCLWIKQWSRLRPTQSLINIRSLCMLGWKLSNCTHSHVVSFAKLCWITIRCVSASSNCAMFQTLYQYKTFKHIFLFEFVFISRCHHEYAPSNWQWHASGRRRKINSLYIGKLGAYCCWFLPKHTWCL